MTFSKYDRKDIIQSIYCYAQTEILKNKLSIQDPNLLEEAEAEYTAQRLLELEAEPLKGRFSLSYLQNIHHYIFQDIYPFAGKLRTEDISKGDTMFARSQHIKGYTNKILTELKMEVYLKGLPLNQFSNRIAYYMAELNIIHPFREGNGRAIREFIRSLAANCSYTINWNAIDKNILLNASILSVKDISELTRCIEASIEK